MSLTILPNEDDNDINVNDDRNPTDPDAAKSKKYWESVSPTVNGMLGGFAKINHVDIQESRKLILNYFSPRRSKAVGDVTVSKPTANLALDCGAGIGRIAKNLLLSFADQVDLLEQGSSFLEKADEFIGSPDNDRIGMKFCSSLQDFLPKPNRIYDIIWVQWVTGYLTDSELVQFFIKTSKILNHNHGIIVVKDNTTRGEEEDPDMTDSSITRPKSRLTQIFLKSNLDILKEKRQGKFPSGLYPVHMWVLRPRNATANIDCNHEHCDNEK